MLYYRPPSVPLFSFISFIFLYLYNPPLNSSIIRQFLYLPLYLFSFFQFEINPHASFILSHFFNICIGNCLIPGLLLLHQSTWSFEICSLSNHVYQADKNCNVLKASSRPELHQRLLIDVIDIRPKLNFFYHGIFTTFDIAILKLECKI